MKFREKERVEEKERGRKLEGGKERKVGGRESWREGESCTHSNGSFRSITGCKRFFFPVSSFYFSSSLFLFFSSPKEKSEGIVGRKRK